MPENMVRTSSRVPFEGILTSGTRVRPRDPVVSLIAMMKCQLMPSSQINEVRPADSQVQDHQRMISDALDEEQL